MTVAESMPSAPVSHELRSSTASVCGLGAAAAGACCSSAEALPRSACNPAWLPGSPKGGWPKDCPLACGVITSIDNLVCS